MKEGISVAGFSGIEDAQKVFMNLARIAQDERQTWKEENDSGLDTFN